MRSIAAMMLSCALLVALGCSNMGYEARLTRTLEEKQRNKRLDDNLQKAPTEGKLKELSIFVRPPKALQASKEFTLGEVAAGAFDETKTFYEGTKTFLHVVARKKQAKKAPAKGAAAEAPPGPREPFNTAIISLLKAVYSDDENIAPEKLKDFAEAKPNTYKRLIFETGADNAKKRVEVYIYKQGDYDVALIFQYDPADKNALSSKISLCLESFCVDSRARAKYVDPTGSGEEDQAASTGTGTL